MGCRHTKKMFLLINLQNVSAQKYHHQGDSWGNSHYFTCTDFQTTNVVVRCSENEVRWVKSRQTKFVNLGLTKRGVPALRYFSRIESQCAVIVRQLLHHLCEACCPVSLVTGGRRLICSCTRWIYVMGHSAIKWRNSRDATLGVYMKRLMMVIFVEMAPRGVMLATRNILTEMHEHTGK